MSEQIFRPNWASAPGDTILDILHERNLTIYEFANRLGISPEDVEDLLQGKAAITLATARQLVKTLGASVEFWMNRDFQYREDIARRKTTDAQWASEFPFEDMVRFGWISLQSGLSNKIDALLRYFDVPNIRAWNELYANLIQTIAFKKSHAFESRPASVAVWLRQGEIQANGIKCQPWNKVKFEATLSSIKSLTREKDPQKFIPKLVKLCADCGVAFVIVRTPRGCPASGATRFLTEDKAIMLLSFRHLSDDHFWFAFFHEAGHLLLHGNTILFIEDTDNPSTIEEEEANEFAANTLIPLQFRPELIKLRANEQDVIRFAVKVGIAPGIVVGQLQHLGLISYKNLHWLKRRYQWKE